MLVVGNWKMNLDLAAARQLSSAIAATIGPLDTVDVGMCPPFVALDAVFAVLHGTGIRLGAQNMHEEEGGAYTGEVSASMLRAVGCHYVILGHSERRQYAGETDQTVSKKARKAREHNLVPIVCVGESLPQREAGTHQAVVEKQVMESLSGVDCTHASELVVAYEPVWAIGTGEVATPEQAQEVHAGIRAWLAERFDAETAENISVLYGGSCKPGNAAELFAQPDIDGGLIGGASLNAEDFTGIIKARTNA